jgi:hypothetical protein
MGMGTEMGGYHARYAKREIRRQRRKLLAYVGLVVLAAATAVVVAMVLQR